jgi:hypothetical protein
MKAVVVFGKQWTTSEDSSVEEQMIDTHPDAGSNPAPAPWISLLS